MPLHDRMNLDPKGGRQMEKRMVIIGAGIARLSTSCYALMNGYKTTIFEMHTIPRVLHCLETEGIHFRCQHAHARRQQVRAI